MVSGNSASVTELLVKHKLEFKILSLLNASVIDLLDGYVMVCKQCHLLQGTFACIVPYLVYVSIHILLQIF